MNADDLGLHADIDRGIVACARAGVVNSASVCVQGESLDRRMIDELRSLGVKIGLHVTLVGEPWVTDGRVIPKWPALVRNVMTGGRAMREAIAREVNAQHERFIDRLGQQPQHVDSHQHVHLFGGIWEPCLRIAEMLRMRLRVPQTHWRNLKRSPAGLALQALAVRRARSVRASENVPRPPRCLALAHAGKNSASVLLAELGRERGHDVELVAHPGFNSSELQRKYRAWRFDWDAERNALLDPRFVEGAREMGYRLEER